MTHPTPTDVIERFEEEFGKETQSTSLLDLYDFYEFDIYDDIKKFLLQEIERARAEELEKIIKICWKLHRDETEEENIYFNEALDLMIFKLQTLEESK